MAINGYSIKNVPYQINKEYVIMAYFRIFLPLISRCYGPHILKKFPRFSDMPIKDKQLPNPC